MEVIDHKEEEKVFEIDEKKQPDSPNEPSYEIDMQEILRKLMVHLHVFTWIYQQQENPTPEETEMVVKLLTSFGSCLPCGICRVHYKKYLEEHPIENALNANEVFEWTVDLHNDINEKQKKTIVDYKQASAYAEQHAESVAKDALLIFHLVAWSFPKNRANPVLQQSISSFFESFYITFPEGKNRDQYVKYMKTHPVSQAVQQKKLFEWTVDLRNDFNVDNDGQTVRYDQMIVYLVRRVANNTAEMDELMGLNQETENDDEEQEDQETEVNASDDEENQVGNSEDENEGDISTTTAIIIYSVLVLALCGFFYIGYKNITKDSGTKPPSTGSVKISS